MLEVIENSAFPQLNRVEVVPVLLVFRLKETTGKTQVKVESIEEFSNLIVNSPLSNVINEEDYNSVIEVLRIGVPVVLIDRGSTIPKSDKVNLVFLN